MNENIIVRLSTEDKKALNKLAEAKRLKLATYIRYQLTKDLK